MHKILEKIFYQDRIKKKYQMLENRKNKKLWNENLKEGQRDEKSR